MITKFLLTFTVCLAFVVPVYAGFGDLDSDFGGAEIPGLWGVRYLQVKTSPFEQVLLAGTLWAGSFATVKIGTVARLAESGVVLDPEFDQGGKVSSGTSADSLFFDLYGRLLISGTDWQLSPSYFYLQRLLPDGQSDSAFGANGMAVAQELPIRSGLSITVDGDHRILVAGSSAPHSRGSYVAVEGQALLARFLDNGDPDTRFGSAGVAALSFHGEDARGIFVGVDSADRILVGTNYLIEHERRCRLQRLHDDGAIDVSYGINGGVELSEYCAAVSLDKQNRLLVLYANLPLNLGNQVTRLGSDGLVDLEFGDSGVAGLSDDYDSLTVDWDDAIYLVGTGDFGSVGKGVRVARLTVAGALDENFGTGGMAITSLAPADSTRVFGLAHGAVDQQRRLVVAFNSFDPPPSGFGISWANAWALRYQGPDPQSVPIFEFYNTRLNHYFMTGGAEAAGLDKGAAGPGWSRTGGTFLAWNMAGGPPAGARPVCRFYGTPGVGPNTHFFTLMGAECEQVKRDPGWLYEGLAFYAVEPRDGQCPPGLTPLYRSYNNRWSYNDSNHRFTTDPVAHAGMIAQGWVDEGVAMCVEADT